MVTHPDPRKGPVDRTPPTGRLTVTHTKRQESGNGLFRTSQSAGYGKGQ